MRVAIGGATLPSTTQWRDCLSLRSQGVALFGAVGSTSSGSRGSSSSCTTTCSAGPGSRMATTVAPALVHNGKPVECALDSKEWLKNAPRGAYTTARTVQGDLVFMLSSHVQRLATSANLMVDADAKAADHMQGDLPLFHSDALRPLVVESMRASVEQLRRSPGVQGVEAKLTVLLTWSSDGTPDLWCHAEPLLPRPKPPVKVLVKGLPRVNAKAKDSEWVRQRQGLEEARPPGVDEVLMASRGGEVTEGLTSNFFVLSDQGEVVTAGEGALSGTVRELVLQVCADCGVPVVLRAPRLADVDGWRGAFITSTSRLLLPICQVLYESPSGQQAVKEFVQQHPLLEKLDAEVLARVVLSSEPLSGRPGAAGPQ